MGTRAASRRHGNRGEKALFYLIITLQYVELIACIIEIAGSIYLAVRGPGDSVAVVASIAMLIASSTSLCVLVVHQLAAKSLQGQSLREYRRRQRSLRGIMGSFLILLLIAWTTTGVFSIVEATRSAGCHDSGDARRYWRGNINCMVQKATLAIALLMIIVTLALLAIIFTLDNSFAASLSGLHRRNHTEEEELHLSHHPIYANMTVTPYREKRIKAPLFNDTTPNFDAFYPNDSPTSIDTSSPTPRPLNQVMASPSGGSSDAGNNTHCRQRSWLPPLKFHEHTVTLHPSLQSTSAVNLLPSPPKPSDPPSPSLNPAVTSTPDLATPNPRPEPPFRSAAGLTRTKTAATMASSVYSRHTNTNTTTTARSDDDEADTLFSRHPSLSSLSTSSHGGSPYYSSMKTPPAAKTFIRHPATRNPFAVRVVKPSATTTTSTTAVEAMADRKKPKARPRPIIGGPNPNNNNNNPFPDSPRATTTINPTPPQKPNNNNKSTPSRPRSSPSLPPSKFWMYARQVQRSANAAQDGAFPIFPLRAPSISRRGGAPGGNDAPKGSPGRQGRRRSNTVPSTGPLRGDDGVGGAVVRGGVAAPKEEACLENIHPAFRCEMAKQTGDGEPGRQGGGGGEGMMGQRSQYERLRKSPMGGLPLGLPLVGGLGEGEVLVRSKSKSLLKKGGARWGRVGAV